MGLFGPSFNALDKAIGAAGMRQEALANNVANVNTPGYRRVDVDGSFQGRLASALKEAEAGDETALAKLSPSLQPDMSVSVRADGSSVDIDQEMAFLAENNVRYNALVQLASKQLNVLQYVVSDGRR